MNSIFMRFPNGKAKAVTLSYDDGVEQDIRLIEIMKKNKLKGTFNINSGLYAPEDVIHAKGTVHRRMSKKQCVELYKTSGMEIAVHSLMHSHLENLSSPICTNEILQDRINLETDYDVMVRGMAYPYGTYNDNVVGILKQCGIVYSRTVESTERFDVPSDWLRLPATCHHNNPRLMELAHNFIDAPVLGQAILFYLWGHSYEFEANDNWIVIEEFAEYIGNRDDIWYATNIEICDYVTAFQRLIFSVGGRRVCNPTDIALYFQNGKRVICVKPGETITY